MLVSHLEHTSYYSKLLSHRRSHHQHDTHGKCTESPFSYYCYWPLLKILSQWLPGIPLPFSFFMDKENVTYFFNTSYVNPFRKKFVKFQVYQNLLGESERKFYPSLGQAEAAWTKNTV
jgi:hypothetical protein